MVVLQLPLVKRKNETRPQKCPYCQGETFQRWGKVRKPLRGNRYRTVQVYRHRCAHCRRTFRPYPEGVERTDQTQRLRTRVAIWWVWGLSLGGECLALAAFGLQLSPLSLWWDMPEQADLLGKRRQWQRVWLLGVDRACPQRKGKSERC